ncbi:MAG TPA: hypothetical protein VEZ40_00360 [Pyrinomonadaceae bacterium]|nr:hypothetical protein [Pyrinomonadaceae bacterium]
MSPCRQSDREVAGRVRRGWKVCLVYIAQRLPLLESSDVPVFLHGDVHAGNLLLAEEGGRWRITA